MTTDAPNWRQFAREVCWQPRQRGGLPGSAASASPSIGCPPASSSAGGDPQALAHPALPGTVTRCSKP
jgi:hypothetical protein